MTAAHRPDTQFTASAVTRNFGADDGTRTRDPHLGKASRVMATGAAERVSSGHSRCVGPSDWPVSIHFSGVDGQGMDKVSAAPTPGARLCRSIPPLMAAATSSSAAGRPYSSQHGGFLRSSAGGSNSSASEEGGVHVLHRRVVATEGRSRRRDRRRSRSWVRHRPAANRRQMRRSARDAAALVPTFGPRLWLPPTGDLDWNL